MFIRYWSWTNSTDIPPEPPVVIGGGGGAFRPDKVLSAEDMLRIRLRNDDDLLLFVVAAWTTIRE
jgi:hypothetical protein